MPLAPEPFQPPNGWKPGQAPVVAPCGRLAYVTPASILSKNQSASFERAVEACRQAVVDAVGDLHGLIQVLHPADGRDRQEHLVLPQAMLEGQVGHEGRLAVVALVVHAAGLDVTAGQEFAASLVDLFGEVLEVVVGALVDDRARCRSRARSDRR